MEIRCRKGDCAYNNGCSCNAKAIDVTRGIACETYIKDELKKSLIIQNGNLFEVSEELVARNLRNVHLKCMAKGCLYNQDTKCQANGISVIDNEDDAECATFIAK